MGLLRQDYCSGLHALLQGIFPTQGPNPHLLHLLHWQVSFLQLVPPGKPHARHTWTKMRGVARFHLPVPATFLFWFFSLLRHMLTCWPFPVPLSISGVIKSLRELTHSETTGRSPLYGIQNQCVKLPQSVVLIRISLICFLSRFTLVRDYCFLHGMFYLDATRLLPQLPRLHSRPAVSSSLQERRQVHSKPKTREVTLFFFPGSLLLFVFNKIKALWRT